jgi:hypothetical protein
MGFEKRHVGIRGIVVVIAGIALAASSAPGATTTTTPFLGITLHQRTETSPRPLKLNVAVIDLTAPGIDFRVTGDNGALPEETTRQRTRDFLIQQDAQLAINASFFTVDTGAYADNSGLVVSDGERISPHSDYHALNLSSTNVATIVRQVSGDTTGFASTPSVSLWNAVAGNRRLVTNGVNNITSPNSFDTTLNPRTAAGVTNDSKLVLVTVDGRQDNVSEGMTTIELADLLISYGVRNGINLDGGGSTTMAIADPSPRLLNTPSDGSARAVGTNLAVFALPIPEPATGSAVIGVAFILASRRRPPGA